MISALAESLAYDLLKGGAKQLQDKLLGDEQQRALNQVAGSAFDEALLDITRRDEKIVEPELKNLLANKTTREFLVSFALSETVPTVGDFSQIGANAISQPTLDVLRRFIPLFAKGLLNAASKSESPLYNQISLERLNRVTDLMRDIPDDITELKQMMQILLERFEDPFGRFQAEHQGLIFISYAREGGGREFAKKLRSELEAYGFNLWQDVVDMEGGKSWFSQIQEAIRGSKAMVLVINDNALNSSNVRDEWNFARQIGVPILPVTWNTNIFEDAPRWLSKYHIFILDQTHKDYSIQHSSFINQLNNPPDVRPIPFIAPQLPDQYLLRSKLYNSILGSLTDSDQQAPKSNKLALYGGGGFGKTVLAIAICHDPRIKSAYDDGIIWFQFSQATTQSNVVQMLNTAIQSLGEPSNFGPEEFHAASAKWQQVIQDKDILVVLDDVWKSHLPQHILVRGNSGKGDISYIITTRSIDVVARTKAQKVSIEMLDEGEDFDLISNYVIDKVDDLSQLYSLLPLLGRWALFIDLTGAQIRALIENGRSLQDAVEYIRKRLQKSVTFLEKDVVDDDETYRNNAISTSIDASVERLPRIPPNFEQRFYELSIFPEDMLIPIVVVERLWKQLANYDRITTEDALEAMQKLSLFISYEPSESFQLHDVVRQVTHQRLQDSQSIHSALISSYTDLTQLPDLYSWSKLAFHLVGSDALHTLKELLFEYRYLKGKIIATDFNSLLSDFDFFYDDTSVTLLRNALRLSAHILSIDSTQLATQLLSRLAPHNNIEEVATLLASAKQDDDVSLTPLFGSAQPAGQALIRSLKGHTHFVVDLAIFENHIVSTSSDRTIRIWNWMSGELLRTIDMNESIAFSVDIVGDYLFSASTESILNIWNWQTGEFIRSLEGHSASISSFTTYDNFVVSGSRDRSIKIWNWQTGELIRSLRGHASSITEIVIQDSYLISGSEDHTIKIWNWQTGKLLRTLVAHTARISTIAVLDNILVSGAYDNTIRVWDWQTGSLIRIISADGIVIRSIALFNEYAVVGTNGADLLVLNWQTGQILHQLFGHRGIIRKVVISKSTAISASNDGTINIWNWMIADNFQRSETHDGGINSVCLTDKFLISGADDKNVKVWDIDNGKVLQTLEGHTDRIWDIAYKDDLIFSASHDTTIRIWDLSTGHSVRTLVGGSGYVNSIAISDEFIVSASSASLDNSIKIWNWQTGEHVLSLFGHKDYILDVAIFDKIVVSSSNDGEIIVWDWKRQNQLAVLRGHHLAVWSVIITSNMIISSSDDSDIIIWDANSLMPMFKLTGHRDAVRNIYVKDNILFSASLDRTIKIWSLVNQKCLCTFVFDSPQQAITCSDDFSLIVTGDKNGSVQFMRTNQSLLRILQKESQKK